MRVSVGPLVHQRGDCLAAVYAANCPSNGGKVVWENWIEQDDYYLAPPGTIVALFATPKHRLHGSLVIQHLLLMRRLIVVRTREIS